MTTDGIGNIGKGLRNLGIWLAVGAFLVALVISGTLEKIKPSDNTITVKGLAERRVTSDTAVWRGWYVARGPVLASAYATLKQHGDLIAAFLREHGCAPGDVGFAPVSVQTEYKKTEKGISTGEIEQHILTSNFAVTSTNVEAVAQLAIDVAGLIEKGVELNSSSPEYYVSNLDRCKMELLGEATRNARERATQLATNSGSEVGALRSASQGVFQITPVYSTETSDYGMYDTRTVDKTVKAVVTVEFAVKE